MNIKELKLFRHNTTQHIKHHPNHSDTTTGLASPGLNDQDEFKYSSKFIK